MRLSRLERLRFAEHYGQPLEPETQPEFRYEMADRAYSYITRSEAVVGNAAAERRFALFPGYTLSLRQVIAGRGYIEWIERPVLDWELNCRGNGGSGVPAVPEWSEACDETGASLWAQWNTPNLVVRTWCLAFHRIPALVRGLTVSPRHSAPQCIAVERLILRRDGAGILDDCLTHRMEYGAWTGRRAATELKGGGGAGLLLGTDSEGWFQLFNPDPAVVRVGFDPLTDPSDPEDALRCVVIVPYTGSPAAAAEVLEEAIRQLRIREAARLLQNRESPA